MLAAGQGLRNRAGTQLADERQGLRRRLHVAGRYLQRARLAQDLLARLRQRPGFDQGVEVRRAADAFLDGRVLGADQGPQAGQ